MVRSHPRIDVKLESEKLEGFEHLHSLNRKILHLKRLKGSEVANPRIYIYVKTKEDISSYHISEFIHDDIEGNIGTGLDIAIPFPVDLITNAEQIAIAYHYSNAYFPWRSRTVAIYRLGERNGLLKERTSYHQFLGFRSQGIIEKEMKRRRIQWLNTSK